MVRRSVLFALVIGVVVLLTAAVGWAQPAGYETPTPEPSPTEGITTFPSPPPETDPPSEPPPVVPPTEPPVVPPTSPPFDPPADPPADPPTLASTGIPLTTAAVGAGLLIAGGVSILGVVRRRRRA